MSTRFEKEAISTENEKWKWIHTQHEPNNTLASPLEALVELQIGLWMG